MSVEVSRNESISILECGLCEKDCLLSNGRMIEYSLVAGNQSFKSVLAISTNILTDYSGKNILPIYCKERYKKERNGNRGNLANLKAIVLDEIKESALKHLIWFGNRNDNHSLLSPQRTFEHSCIEPDTLHPHPKNYPYP